LKSKKPNFITTAGMPGVCTTDCQVADPGGGSCRRAAMHASVLVGFIISVFAAPWIHPLENLGFFAAIRCGKKDLFVCSTRFETEEEKNSKLLEALKKEFVFLKYKTRTTRATGARAS
jgi:hypothetical protein